MKTDRQPQVTNDNAFRPPAIGDGVCEQYGALCWRLRQGALEVLLVTSRDTGRWVIPKGWPIKGLSPEASAAREAFEEAGAEGKPCPTCLGLYSYDKGLIRAGDNVAPMRIAVPCVVAVYGLKVKTLLPTWPEMHQRRRKWFNPRKAAQKVAEPELRALLEQAEALLLPRQDESTPRKAAKA